MQVEKRSGPVHAADNSGRAGRRTGTPRPTPAVTTNTRMTRSQTKAATHRPLTRSKASARAAATPPARPTPAAARTPQPCTCRLCVEGSPHSSSSSHSSYASSSSLYGSSSSSSSSDGSSVIEVDCTGQPIDYENEDYDPVEEWDQFGNPIVVVG
ncbi:hypothetical protein FRX31_017122 [Thalictrum thalictroides]|uniref:Uncharacterized protein n=1 Tax=Thalictrum thalictroides TaxID=46969 RepID=A0A7J6W7R8_THATH|nr:hypothetical protein FRX31_017122 [Thalictrum thalictroides]